MSSIKNCIFNCDSIGQVYIKLGETKFNEEQSADNQILRIEIEINESFNDNINVKSIDDILKDVKTPVIIFFKYLIDQRVKIFWRIHESSAFEKLDFNDCNEKVVSNFLHCFLVQEILKNNSGILKSSKNKHKLDILDIGSQDGRNLLLIACEKNDLSVVEKLLQLNFDVDYEDDDKFIAIEIAWDNFVKNDSNKVQREISEKIMITLLSDNSMFPRKISNRKCKIETKFKHSKSELIKQFLFKNVELHVIVQQMHEYEDKFNELIEKINEIRENHKHMRKFYNRNNESLMLTAIKSENVILRDKLIELGASIGQHEINSFAEACSEKYDRELNRFHKQSRLNAFDYPKYYLQILLARSKINYNDQNPSDHWKILKEAYETIDENQECSLILQVAATRKELHILFDFVNDTACYANPTTTIESRGTSDGFGRITIGAKNLLLGGDMRNEILGVITQELCHAAMFVIYMNSADPFQMGDSIEKKQFENEVMKECERNQNVEPELIGVVLTAYQEDDQSAELITRPPHIWMHHLNNPEKIKDCEEKFPLLFNFFNNLVIPEMKKYLKLYPKLLSEDDPIEFDELTEPMKAFIANTELNFNGMTNSIHGIIDDESKEYKILESLSSRQIKDWILHNNPIQFEQKHEQEKKIAIIDRELIPYSYNQEVYDPENFDEMPTPFILADEPGSGKTETLKLMAINFKKSEKKFWTSFISLKKHESKVRKINSENADTILVEILNLEPLIEAKMFQSLFSRGRVLLLFDGYDEVCAGSNEFPMNIFESIKVKGNKISISTRPHYTKSLENNLKIETFKLKPLSLEQKEEIIKSVHSTIDDDDKKPIEDVLKELKKVLEIIKQNEWYEQEFDNPLLISILAELCTSKQVSMKEEDLNIYNIFEQMTLLLEKRVGGKVEISECSSFIHKKFTNREVHQVLALKSTFQHISIKNLKIMKGWELVRDEWSVDRIQRFGLVTLNKEFEKDQKPDYINFVHKRYEEFFVATYIIDFITHPCGFEEEEFQEFIKFILFYSIDCYNDNDNDKFIISKIEHEKNKKKEIVKSENLRNQLICEANRLKNEIINPSPFSFSYKKFNEWRFFNEPISCLELILIFLSDETQFLKEFWNVERKCEEFDMLNYVLKNDVNFSGIVKTLYLSFGPNWDQKFKFGEKKIYFTKYLEDETFQTEDEKQEKLGTVKMVEIAENFLNREDRISFYSAHFQKVCDLHKEIIKKIFLEPIENSIDESYFEKLFDLIFMENSGLYIFFGKLSTEPKEQMLLIKKEIEDKLNSPFLNNKSSLFRVYNFLVLKTLQIIHSAGIAEYVQEFFNILLTCEDQKLDFKDYFQSYEIGIEKLLEISDDGLIVLQKFIKEAHALYGFDLSKYLFHEYDNMHVLISNECKFNRFYNFLSDLDSKFQENILEKCLFSYLKSNSFVLKNIIKILKIILKIINRIKLLKESSSNSNDLDSFYHKLQDYLIANKMHNLFANITDENYDEVINLINLVFQNNLDMFRKFLTDYCYYFIIIIEDEEKLKNFKEIVKDYSINLTECNEKEQILKILTNTDGSCRYECIKEKFVVSVNKYAEQDAEIYQNIANLLKLDQIINVLLSSKTSRFYSDFVKFTRNVFNVSELSVFNKNAFYVPCNMFKDKSNVDIIGKFLDDICDNHETSQKLKSTIFLLDIPALVICSPGFLEKILYALSKFQLNFENFDTRYLTNKLNVIFNCVTHDNIETFKEIMQRFFPDTKSRRSIDYCNLFNKFNSLEYISKIDLIEYILKDFLKDDETLINEIIEKMLIYRIQKCTYYCNIFLNVAYELKACEKHNPLIGVFFRNNFSLIESLTKVYINYPNTWKWVQKLFLKFFPFDSVIYMDEKCCEKLNNFLKIIFKGKERALGKHFRDKYDEQILDDLKNKGVGNFIETHDISDDVEDDDNDKDDDIYSEELSIDLFNKWASNNFVYKQ